MALGHLGAEGRLELAEIKLQHAVGAARLPRREGLFHVLEPFARIAVRLARIVG